MKIAPPETEAELLTRATALSGLCLYELAERVGISVPNDLRQDKGWCGQLLETLLGTSAKNLSEPDFLELGIELKTIPIDEQGMPLESTYVTVVPLLGENLDWHESIVWHKLKRVLWIPMLATRSIPIKDRIICAPLLWSPDQTEEALLRADWEELTELVMQGGLDKINARIGKALQIRPKAANAKSLGWGIADSGERVQTLPRGFYLRPSFTRSVLLKNF